MEYIVPTYEIELLDGFGNVVATEVVLEPVDVTRTLMMSGFYEPGVRYAALPAELIADFAREYAKAGYSFKPKRTVLHLDQFSEYIERF